MSPSERIDQPPLLANFSGHGLFGVLRFALSGECPKERDEPHDHRPAEQDVD